jgi:hypothetical protein
MPFPYVFARLGAKPLEPFGKGSNALKAGTLDAGPEDPTAWKPYGRPFSPRPGSSGRRPYTRGQPAKARQIGLKSGFGGCLNDFGQPDCQLSAFPDQIRSRADRIGRFPGSFQAFEQDFHVLAEQPLPVPWIRTGTDQFVLRHGHKFTHDKGSQDRTPAVPLKLSTR